MPRQHRPQDVDTPLQDGPQHRRIVRGRSTDKRSVAMLFLVSPVVPCDLGGAVERARRAVGMKHATLAHLMGIPSHQLSDQLARRGHPSLARLLMVGRDPEGRRFLAALWPELAALTGTDVEDPVALLRRALIKLTRPEAKQEGQRVA